MNNPLKYTDPTGLSEEDNDSTDLTSIPPEWEDLLEWLREYCDAKGIDISDLMTDLIKEFYQRLAQKILNSLGLVLFDDDSLFVLGLMSFLEAVVEVCGDLLGMTGAFFCVEAMAIGGAGGQTGACFLYHPDLGWAMYTYAGYLWGAMEGAGASIVAGFWTWHGERDFTFSDWEGWFFNIEGGIYNMIGIGGMYFQNETSPPTITGLGIGPGVGTPGGGIAAARAKYYRAKNWMIPLYLQGIVVPAGGW